MVWTITLLVILLFLFGLSILYFTSNYLSTALVKFAEILKISPMIIGALILATCTSLPEISNSLVDATKGIASIGIGNLFGSVIASLAVTTGIVHIVGKEQKLNVEFSKRLFITIIVAALLFLIFAGNGILSRVEGLILLAVFLIHIIISAKKGFSSLASHFSARRLILPYIIIPLSIFGLIVGGFLVVETSKSLSRLAGIPAAVIGLSIVALGTTTPELFSSIVTARTGNKNLSIGSTLGGAIVVSLLALGLVATIFTIKIDYAMFILPTLFILGLAAINLAQLVQAKKTSRKFGIFLLSSYVFYLLVLLLKVV